ncbi:hypothetical protein HPP92_000318 [Vanilla planifolia]|uniref:Glycosyltransferase n=1 Tax=Vanilla planifolia TaxID=51239 RepID=A0A835S1U0_VANPL|nr:hypothetical protein HPP92_000293 [Vanilla planifolia]KAG0500246.1 hypothetical protein HPP92_000318 [Vanilla planifolia]
MGTEGENLHIVFFPLMAPSHMLPMVDIAKLAAARGVRSTVLTTPANASLVSRTIELANSSLPIPIGLHLISFTPTSGLPSCCENLASFDSDDARVKMFGALYKLSGPFDDALCDLRPDCVVSDSFMPWTYDITVAHGIPRVVFLGSNFFSMCAMHAVQQHKDYEKASPDATAAIVIPGLPHRIEIFRSQIMDLTMAPPEFREILLQASAVDRKSFGEVVNSFYELEAEYYEYYTKEMGKRAWHVGPVSLCNRDPAAMRARGAAENDGRCLRWLDEQRKPCSVLYVCFGSLSIISDEQLRELAKGLEAADHPFILVVRKSGDEWMPEGFEDRVKEKGLVVRGWAPQIEILAHRATAGFMTHCGWNSSLEGICAGLPMLTWPMFAEQFYNERFLVDVLKVGVAVGSKEHVVSHEKRNEVIGAADVEAAVRKFMAEGKEADERRRRAMELGEMARMAMEEGGSSYNDMGKLLQDLKELRTGKVVAGQH